MPFKMKRKGLDQVSQDFSDFSLSSPATKIRRLDAELPPIVEEEEPETALVYEQPTPILEESPSPPPDNQERALVLFKPINPSPFVSPSSFSYTIDSDIVSGIKNQRPWSRHSVEEEAACRDKNNDDRLAVVPWAPTQFPPPVPSAHVSSTEPPELMEAEQMGEASMDIEQDNSNSSIHPTMHGESMGMEGLHPWQQQHCLLPQLPQTTSTPIPWTR